MYFLLDHGKKKKKKKEEDLKDLNDDADAPRKGKVPVKQLAQSLFREKKEKAGFGNHR